jgi:prepilin-type N-terminal cleavage/methylation domain-containing protein
MDKLNLKYNRDRGARGFTLVELVLVISIMGVLAGVFVKYIDEGNRMFDQVDARRELRQDARAALVRMVREIRQLRSASDVLTADTVSLSFYGVNDSLYTINYSGVSGESLMFQRGSLSNVLATHVDSLAFDYYQNDGTAAVPLVNPSDTDIYRVTIFLRLLKGNTAVSLKTGTHLRNL